MVTDEHRATRVEVKKLEVRSTSIFLDLFYGCIAISRTRLSAFTPTTAKMFLIVMEVLLKMWIELATPSPNIPKLKRFFGAHETGAFRITRIIAEKAGMRKC